MDRALYGPDGFYVLGEGASGHFHTSVSGSSTVTELFAAAIGELLDRVDFALGRPDPLDLLDVGAGSGALLEAVLRSIGSDLAARTRPTVVERRPRPADLSPYLTWLDGIPDMTGLLIANEWLDNVALDVVVADVAGNDVVLLVDSAGVETPGHPPTEQESAWLARWWPSGHRREIGSSRDIAWGTAVSQVHRGLAVTIDYSHVAADRPAYGTLTGFRRGRETAPIPDGSCDLTAHVAIDSVAAAGVATGPAYGKVVRTLLTDQRTALSALGVSGRRPDYAADPAGYTVALQRASDAAELIERGGLGAFAWLLQGVDLDPTAILR